MSKPKETTISASISEDLSRDLDDLREQVRHLQDDHTRMKTIQEMQGKMDEMRRNYLAAIIALIAILAGTIGYLLRGG
jgi:DNA invertase Pin-like site-specific DNA recombinase